MKVVLVHQKDAKNINAFSGTPYFMTKAIKEEFDEVQEYDLFEPWGTVKRAYENGIEDALKPIGHQLNDYLRTNAIKADYVICEGGTSCIPYYAYHLPIVFWHDSSWHTYLQGYSTADKFNAFQSEHRNLYLWDQAALEKTDVIVYSSDFVAEASIRNYLVSPEKVKVIPFGANFDQSLSNTLLERVLKMRLQSRTLNFTFIGKDWKRKGLLTAIQLVRELNSIGMNAILNVVGCHPNEEEIGSSPYISLWGFLDKSKKQDLEKFEIVLQQTHFLVHPAISEPYGISLCEANAYGIPVIGTANEGLKTIVRQGVNGYLFELESLVQEASIIIREITDDLEKSYSLLFHSTVSEYQKRLNWKSSAQALKKVLSDLDLAPKRP